MAKIACNAKKCNTNPALDVGAGIYIIKLILNALKVDIEQMKESRCKTEEIYKKINMTAITYNQIFEQYNENISKRK